MKKGQIVLGAIALVLAMGAAVMAAPPAVPIQTPLSPTKIPQFVNQLDTLGAGLPVVINPDLTPKTDINISLCEFVTNILPPGTFGKNTPAPPTYAWGYLEGIGCPAPGANVNHSYLGPAVVAVRGVATKMNFYNKLPNANVAQVKAYTTSTDQTLIWGDPLSLDTSVLPGGALRINGVGVWAIPPPPPGPPGTPYVEPPYVPEHNECWAAAQAFVPGVTVAMPGPCNNNYGFFAAQPTTSAYAAPTPAAVHIHGGEVPSVLDGGPDSWWTPNGIVGHGYYSYQNNVGNDHLLGMASYRYPNFQEAAPVWFHDHMLGATRLNVYAGIAGAYVLIDPDSKTPGAPGELAPGLHALGIDTNNDGAFADPPVAVGGNPTLQAGELTIPLIVQDRMFDTTGQLYFPNVGINLEHPFWVPEFVGDVIVVNGKAWPNLNVEPRRYRFLFLNGSNARAYEMFLQSKITGLKGPSMWVIGNDQGYLDTAQEINPNLKPNDKLKMMPGERYEVVIDFSKAAPNDVLILNNTARTPYVGGAPVNGNTTGRIMQFTVLPAAAAPDLSWDPLANAQVRMHPSTRLTVEKTALIAPGVKVDKLRRLTLNEVIGGGGPLEVLVNNTLYDGSKPRPYSDFTPIPSRWNTSYYSELPYEGETEIWEIVNLTADAHPMHPHLVGFQVLNRQALDVKAYMAFYNAEYVARNMKIDGEGPPYNYNNSDPALPPATPNPLCSQTPPAFGDANYVVTQDPITGALAATCVLGGNPDPLAAAALIGPVLPPMPQEIGWKDTVQALPNMVTRILVRFGKPELANTTPSTGVGYDFSPNGGHGYVWHCHIVDHEDNEMMRPYTVIENVSYPHTYRIGFEY